MGRFIFTLEILSSKQQQCRLYMVQTDRNCWASKSRQWVQTTIIGQAIIDMMYVDRNCWAGYKQRRYPVRSDMIKDTDTHCWASYEQTWCIQTEIAGLWYQQRRYPVRSERMKDIDTHCWASYEQTWYIQTEIVGLAIGKEDFWWRGAG